MRMETWISKADTLLAALPYIQKFRGALIVVKFGGSSMEDPDLVKSTMRDIVLMECIGFKPIVVHGGGKAISAELKRQDIPVKFVNGLRHTCERTIAVVDDVLHNQINQNLVELARGFGGPAAAISGKNILTAEKILSKDPNTGKEQDIGFVGGIVSVDVAPIQAALAAGEIPIITPLGKGRDGQIYNINADIAACKIAEAVHARKLVFLSDVPGVLRDPADENSVIPTIRTDKIPDLIQDKILTGGMLPKINSCVHALDAGINKVHMIDGRLRHSLLLEIFTDEGIGTQIVRPDSVM
ncbi:Acetylglutamate kinase [bioreactor metagenome]|uniref:acetylglutamate kinase n=1 Tax=bioreactor metagenome TaxID=1076179 RepID=A0A644YCN3_9ZZZZ